MTQGLEYNPEIINWQAKIITLVQFRVLKIEKFGKSWISNILECGDFESTFLYLNPLLKPRRGRCL